jgi:dipeptidyl aminopeptidase/acylaminoacyl peptidase
MQTAPRPTAILAAVFTVLTLLAAPSAAIGQDPDPVFTVDHVLETEGVRVVDLSDDGRWAVAAVYALEDRLGVDNHRYGDPTYVRPGVAEILVIDTETGAVDALFDGKVQLEAAAWSPDGSRLAVLVRRGDGFEYRVWERERDRFRRVRLPGDRVPAVNTRLDPVWSDDGGTLLLPLRAGDWETRARRAFLDLTEADVVVLDGQEPFLAWEAVRRMGALTVLGAYDMASGRVTQVLDETPLLDAELTADGRLLYERDITEGTDYDRIFGTDGQLMVRGLTGGEPTVVIENTTERGRTVWADDDLTYAYADDGVVYLAHVDSAEARPLVGETDDEGADPEGDLDVPDAPDAADEDDEGPLRFSPVSFSPEGSRLVVRAEGDYFFVRATTGDTVRFLDVDEDADRGPAHRVLGWDGEDAVVVQRESRTEWHRELLRYDVAGGMTQLYETRDLLESVRLSDDGSTVVFESAPSGHPTDLFAGRVEDDAVDDVRRLYDVAPSLTDAMLADAEMVTYRDVDGDVLTGILYYPQDYEEGTAYPTIFYVYETFFDPGFNSFVNVMTAHGYAVMRPSVDLEIGFPGEAWLKGVTAAANELIRMGVADPDRLAVQGTSYGGYAVGLLVTQTDRFAAAVNVSGKVNMVSFYTDSPRLATRNIHAPENSQDRIGATLWEQPQKYVSHSAVMYADRVDTPLLLIGGDQDHNVPNRQLMEFYYALRRLGKDVTWVTYTHGGHGMPTMNAALVRDYYRRILDFYGEHL